MDSGYSEDKTKRKIILYSKFNVINYEYKSIQKLFTIYHKISKNKNYSIKIMQHRTSD